MCTKNVHQMGGKFNINLEKMHKEIFKWLPNSMCDQEETELYCLCSHGGRDYMITVTLANGEQHVSPHLLQLVAAI